MAPHPNSRRQIWLTALIVAVALAGLVAGALTRELIASAGAPPVGQRQTPVSADATTTPLAQTPTPTVSPTVAPTLVHFSIRLTTTPNTAPPGATITITATATADATGQPAPGLTCHLRAPTDGEPALLATWPAPTATNSDGVATWTAVVPSEAPGRYVIEVFAQTPAWYYVGHATFTVSAP